MTVEGKLNSIARPLLIDKLDHKKQKIETMELQNYDLLR